MSKATEQLKTFIQDKLVMSSWGDYEGIKELTLEDLGSLLVLVQAAIAQKVKDAS